MIFFSSRFSFNQKFEVQPILQTDLQKRSIRNNHSVLPNCSWTAVNVLKVSGSSESSTKMPLRCNKDKSLFCHLFPQLGNKGFRVAFGLHLTPPGPGIHIHCPDYPDLFLVLICTRLLNHIKPALGCPPSLSAAAFISQSFHLPSR